MIYVLMNRKRLAIVASALLIVGCNRSPDPIDEPAVTGVVESKSVTLYLAGMNQRLKIW